MFITCEHTGPWESVRSLVNSWYKSTQSAAVHRAATYRFSPESPRQQRTGMSDWGLDGGLFLTAGGDGISSNGALLSLVASG